MNETEQFAFIQLMNRLLNQGFRLEETLNLLTIVYPKVVPRMRDQLDQGVDLASIFKQLKFPSFVVEYVAIGMKTNRLSEAFRRLSHQFAFYREIKQQQKQLLMYPMLLLMVGLVGFEFLRVELYPTLAAMLQSFQVEANKWLTFFAFHSIKCIGGVVLALGIGYYFFPRLWNVLPSIRCYRSLQFSHQISLFIEVGFTLEQTFTELSQILNQKVYRLCELEDYLFMERIPSKYSSFDKSFLHLFSLGLNSNQLKQTLEDYRMIYQDHLKVKWKKLGQTIQLAIFMFIALNIIIIYYVMMAPIMQMSHLI